MFSPRSNAFASKSDGDPECEQCCGWGVVENNQTKPPSVITCKCVLSRLRVQNLDKVWKGLSKAKNVKIKGVKNPFFAYRDQNLLVRAGVPLFQTWLKDLLLDSRVSLNWYVAVITDADLATAWLANVAIHGQVFDADINANTSLTHFTLVDLIDPPELLVIRLGVKIARNQAMPELLSETLMHRAHKNKPTWILDDPRDPLTEGHICYSKENEHILSSWKRLDPPTIQKEALQ